MTKVITYGTFDLFHQGHYNLLKHAKELGDYLIVGITTEQYDKARGKLNVVDSLIKRIDNVRATGFADEIVIEDHSGQKIEDIQKFGVDIFTVGSDWVGAFDYIEPYCKVVYLPRTKDVSSTEKRTDRSPVVQIGIVGTGRVAQRFPKEIKLVSGANAIGVFNPHYNHAKPFMEEHELAFWSNDYDEFLSKVDAVYIASPHETHYEYAKRAILANKHVLCEKPMVFKKAQAEELFELAKKHGVVLMEAIKTAYCPGFNQLVNVARSGIIGDICDVEASFSRLTEDGKRETEDLKYGGAFTEFGSYCLMAIIKLLGKDYKSVSFESVKMPNGLDGYTKANISYDNAIATAKNGVKVKTEGCLIIAGTKGYIFAPSPWWLTKYFEVRYEDPTKIDTYSSQYLGSGMRYEIAEFTKAIGNLRNGGDNASANIYMLTRDESIAITEIYERFLSQRDCEKNKL